GGPRQNGSGFSSQQVNIAIPFVATCLERNTMIEFALFGAGRIGSIHAGNVARSPGVQLKYIVDPNAEYAQTLANRHGAQVATIPQVFEDKSVQAVLICSS